jgi:hypothetical protein
MLAAESSQLRYAMAGIGETALGSFPSNPSLQSSRSNIYSTNNL